MSLSRLQKAVARNISTELRVALPGEIVSYDHTQQRASVRPLIRKKYKDGEVAPLPVIHQVPVVWPRGTDSALTMPLKAGDGVGLIFQDRSLDEWLSSGGMSTPNDSRQHDLSDAIAIPGLCSFNDADGSEDVVLRHGDSKITLKDDGGIEVDGDLSVSGDITATGDIKASGDIVAGAGNPLTAISLKSHIHSGGTLNGSTGGPEPAP